MKKLLSILGAMTLIGTTSTSVVACGVENPTPPTPDTRTDIENKITSPIALGQLSVNTKADFLAKLQTSLAQIPNLNSITPSDYDVYKAKTTTAIQDSDITADNSLNIKITAKGSNFKGEKDNITVTYTQRIITKIDISTIITKLTISNSVIVDINNNNQELDTKIKNTNEIKLLNPKLVNPVIKYFSDDQGKIDVSNQNQQAGDLYVVITANGNDPNYKNSTIPIKITIEKKNLNTITQLTGLNLIADSSKKYDDLWPSILQSNEFKNLDYNGYETFMYRTDHFVDKKNIKELKQKVGIIYVVLKFQKNDSKNWTGITRRLKIVLK